MHESRELCDDTPFHLSGGLLGEGHRLNSGEVAWIVCAEHQTQELSSECVGLSRSCRRSIDLERHRGGWSEWLVFVGATCRVDLFIITTTIVVVAA